MHTTTTAWAHAEMMAIARWFLRDGAKFNATIVGALRRMEANVMSMELLTPHPDIYDRLQRFVRLFVPDDQLIKPPQTGKFLIAGRGFKPGFREAHLQLDRFDATSLGCPGQTPDLIPVKIYRYDHGENGNEGWATLIRTGPSDFSRACLWRWSKIAGGRSENGYPVGAGGVKLPCPSEDEAFRLLRMDPIPPKDRHWNLIPGYKPEENA